ncbi:MAG: M28 family metallopeptidase [Miltoncostaeaceae bacterium]
MSAVRSPAVAALAALALATAAGCAAGDSEAGAPSEGGAVPTTSVSHGRDVARRARVDRFDGRRAFALLARQVRYGPRPAGSRALRRLSLDLRARLPRGRFEAVPGRPRGMRNIVGFLPGRGKAILVGAHYDTKAIPGFVGANDGAAGTAAVVELVRSLAHGRPACARPIRFVLFDGEESPDDSRDFYATGLRGSKVYAARHARALHSVVIVDFVANHGVTLPREMGSDERMWARLRAAAQRVGVGAVFPDEVTGEILDDHTPFARRGIPAIDLIDFSYPHFHRITDDLDAVSARSLDAVGEALVEFLRRESLAPCRR